MRLPLNCPQRSVLGKSLSYNTETEGFLCHICILVYVSKNEFVYLTAYTSMIILAQRRWAPARSDMSIR